MSPIYQQRHVYRCCIYVCVWELLIISKLISVIDNAAKARVENVMVKIHKVA